MASWRVSFVVLCGPQLGTVCQFYRFGQSAHQHPNRHAHRNSDSDQHANGNTNANQHGYAMANKITKPLMGQVLLDIKTGLSKPT